MDKNREKMTVEVIYASREIATMLGKFWSWRFKYLCKNPETNFEKPCMKQLVIVYQGV